MQSSLDSTDPKKRLLGGKGRFSRGSSVLARQRRAEIAWFCDLRDSGELATQRSVFGRRMMSDRSRNGRSGNTREVCC